MTILGQNRRIVVACQVRAAAFNGDIDSSAICVYLMKNRPHGRLESSRVECSHLDAQQIDQVNMASFNYRVVFVKIKSTGLAQTSR